MITFVMVVIGRCCSGSVKRRSWLGLGGVMLVIAAGLAAYGFSSGLGEVIDVFHLVWKPSSLNIASNEPCYLMLL